MRGRFRQVFPISIHALREEGDPQDYTGYKLAEFISIHALREEGDLAQAVRDSKVVQFLSTPSVRRATAAASGRGCQGPISIHALREEGDGVDGASPSLPMEISIHALREEGDDAYRGYQQQDWEFLSTPSVRRATGWFCHGCVGV